MAWPRSPPTGRPEAAGPQDTPGCCDGAGSLPGPGLAVLPGRLWRLLALCLHKLTYVPLTTKSQLLTVEAGCPRGQLWAAWTMHRLVRPTRGAQQSWGGREPGPPGREWTRPAAPVWGWFGGSPSVALGTTQRRVETGPGGCHVSTPTALCPAARRGAPRSTAGPWQPPAAWGCSRPTPDRQGALLQGACPLWADGARPSEGLGPRWRMGARPALTAASEGGSVAPRPGQAAWPGPHARPTAARVRRACGAGGRLQTRTRPALLPPSFPSPPARARNKPACAETQRRPPSSLPSPEP